MIHAALDSLMAASVFVAVLHAQGVTWFDADADRELAEIEAQMAQREAAERAFYLYTYDDTHSGTERNAACRNGAESRGASDHHGEVYQPR